MTFILNHLMSLCLAIMVFGALVHAIGLKERVVIACALCVMSVVIFYACAHAPKNTLKHYMANKQTLIAHAIQQDEMHDYYDVLLCAAMLNQQSQIQPSNRTRLKAAECFEGIQLVSVSNQIIEYVLKQAPKSETALYLKTRAHLKKYGIDSIEFIKELNVLLKTNPNHIDGLWLLAALEYYRGEHAQALMTLNKLEPLIHQQYAQKNSPKKQDKLNKLKQFRLTIEQAVQP